ncbi:MAG TPA: DUF2795 domain-containing protein [Armatimonadota bacterium]|nr:DUF2795 domain-containing protein [Armatimonadota bacterium]
MDFLGSIGDVKKYLEGLSFPASKSEIINHLEEKNAPDNILSIAEKIPDKAYNSIDDIVSNVSSRF